ncbi:MAG: glycosyltransferase family 2 protein, partial [Pseudonocardiaceae bacterium]
MNDVEPVDVILPCLDEAAALPGVLARLPEGYRAIVVDNGSVDGSPEVAAEHGAAVVVEPRCGYGAAVHTGLEAAIADLVCVLDADGSLDAAELPRLVGPVRAGRAELTVGRR